MGGGGRVGEEGAGGGMHSTQKALKQWGMHFINIR